MDTAKGRTRTRATGLSRLLGSAALLVLIHVVASAALAVLYLRHQVSAYGLAGGEAISLGPTMSGGIILVTVLVTSPFAVAEAWSLLSPRGGWVGMVAAVISTAIHSVVGLAPVGLRFAGDVGPVTRGDVSTSLTSSLVIVAGHLVVLVAATVLLTRRAQRTA